MITVHSVAECTTCDEQPPAIQEIIDVDPECKVAPGDVVLDAQGVVWVITHWFDIFSDDPVVEFYRPGHNEPSHVHDICWCKAGKPINDRYEHHITTDPHGPFRLLVVEGK